ncbi:MFS transporter [Clostridia bacterium]|nr:MFS transporter [Clostridia bacterium]
MSVRNSKSFRNFLILWSGDFVANICSGLTAFALGVYAFEQTGSATSVALITLCAFLPTVLLNPIAGVLADRYDRRLMMILGDGLSVLGLVYILFAAASGAPAIWQICLGVGISSVFVALLEPSCKATITDLLTQEKFAKASGLVQLAGSAKYLLSPLIAGFLLTFTGIETILFIDIATLAVTIPTTLFIKKGIAKAERNKQSFFKDFAEGWRVITTNRGVLLVIVMISIATFYIGFVQTLFMPMMLSLTDAKTLGAVESISAVGMLISSLVIGMVTITKKYVKQLIAGFALAGLFIALIGFTPNIFIIGGAGFLFFAALPFVNTSADVLVRRNIPEDKQGRAWGLIGILSQFGFLVSYAVSGPLADDIFNPMLVDGGVLSGTVGRVIGTGESRGIGLLLIVSGLFVTVLAVCMRKVKAIRSLEDDAK